MSQLIAHVEETGRTETSKYPEEKKANAIPWVEAIERGAAQTSNRVTKFYYSKIVLEKQAKQGESPVYEIVKPLEVEE